MGWFGDLFVLFTLIHSGESHSFCRLLIFFLCVCVYSFPLYLPEMCVVFFWFVVVCVVFLFVVFLSQSSSLFLLCENKNIPKIMKKNPNPNLQFPTNERDAVWEAADSCPMRFCTNWAADKPTFPSQAQGMLPAFMCRKTTEAHRSQGYYRRKW